MIPRFLGRGSSKSTRVVSQLSRISATIPRVHFNNNSNNNNSINSNSNNNGGRNITNATGHNHIHNNFRRALSSSVQSADATEGLSEEQGAIYDLARDFADSELLPHAAEWDEKEIFPIDALRQAAALGFGAITVDPEHGGSGLGRLESSLIYEALSTACPSTTAYLSIHNMVASTVDTYASDAVKKDTDTLALLASMESTASYCLTEPGAGSDAGSLSTRAVPSPDGSHFVLNGAKAFISGAGASDFYLVMARVPEGSLESSPRGGITAFLIDARDKPEGLSFAAKERKLGWNSQPTRAVSFDDLVVPSTHVLGQVGQGFKIALSALDGGRISIASCSVGGAQACFDHAVTYTKDRRQFGQRIADFQSTQFKLADMASELTAARMIVRSAARAVDEDSTRKTYLSAMAKRYATDAAFDIANAALQMHGGYGYLKDFPVERYLRDLRVHQILEGTNEIMRVVMGRQILQD